MAWTIVTYDQIRAAEVRSADLSSREQAQVEACKLHFEAGQRVERIQGPNGEQIRFEDFRDRCVRRSSPIPRALGPK